MVRINKDYIVDVDTYEYTAKQDLHKEDKEGNPIYKTVGHYGTLKNAILGIFKHKGQKVLSEGEYSLNEAVDALSAIKTELVNALSVCEVEHGENQQ